MRRLLIRRLRLVCPGMALALAVPGRSKARSANAPYTTWSAVTWAVRDSAQFSALDQINRRQCRSWKWRGPSRPGTALHVRPARGRRARLRAGGGQRSGGAERRHRRKVWSRPHPGAVGTRGINYWRSADGKDGGCSTSPAGTSPRSTRGRARPSRRSDRTGAWTSESVCDTGCRSRAHAAPDQQPRTHLRGPRSSSACQRRARDTTPTQATCTRTTFGRARCAGCSTRCPATARPAPTRGRREPGKPRRRARLERADNRRGRGIAYVPFGTGRFDFYGGDRPGNNLFANSLVALDARTGKRLWHFQIVHHDVWDYDLPVAPRLLTIRRNGRRRTWWRSRPSRASCSCSTASPASRCGRSKSGPCRSRTFPASRRRPHSRSRPGRRRSHGNRSRSRTSTRTCPPRSARRSVSACAATATKGCSPRRASGEPSRCPVTAAARTGAGRPSIPTRGEIYVLSKAMPTMLRLFLPGGRAPGTLAHRSGHNRLGRGSRAPEGAGSEALPKGPRALHVAVQLHVHEHLSLTHRAPVVGDRRLRPEHRRHQVARAARHGRRRPRRSGFRRTPARTGHAGDCWPRPAACCSRRPVRTGPSAPTTAGRQSGVDDALPAASDGVPATYENRRPAVHRGARRRRSTAGTRRAFPTLRRRRRGRVHRLRAAEVTRAGFGGAWM